MERQQFNKLVQVLQNDTVFQNKGNKPQAPVEFQLVIFLRRLGSKDDILKHAFGRLKARFKALKELSINDQNDDDDDDDDNDRYDWEDESDEILKLEGELKKRKNVKSICSITSN
ncbi:hypothetical protein RhiirB3_436424 [Rhizophagus irregularis]|nr:hypothetical protein RhiirB3_436424 [Rhizophagus irregularis]